MSQYNGNDLSAADQDATTKATNTSPTPVPTTILKPFHRHGCHSTQPWIKGMTKPFPCDCDLKDALTEIETYYTTRLKKCIGEEELLEHPNNLDNALAAAQNVLRAKILKNWEAEK